MISLDPAEHVTRVAQLGGHTRDKICSHYQLVTRTHWPFYSIRNQLPGHFVQPIGKSMSMPIYLQKQLSTFNKILLFRTPLVKLSLLLLYDLIGLGCNRLCFYGNITLVVYLTNFPITKIIIVIILFAKFMVYNKILPRFVVIIIIASIVPNAIVIAKSVTVLLLAS